LRGRIHHSRLRTSIIVDPSDGKVPPLTPLGQQRAAARAEAARTAPSDSAESRSLGERCISWGNEGPPMLGSTYQANLQFMQTKDAFVIRHEIMNGIRIVPVDGTPHLPNTVRLLHGDSRGRWEGNTLVVDTTNFTSQTPFHGSSENLHVVERFTRTSAETILYEFTVDDPHTWVKPWSAQLVMGPSNGQIYEFACHEGNYGLRNNLSGARAEDKRAAEKNAR
jgi:hypothetical protein